MVGRGAAPDMTDTPAYRKRATLRRDRPTDGTSLHAGGGILRKALKSVANSIIYRVYCNILQSFIFFV